MDTIGRHYCGGVFSPFMGVKPVQGRVDRCHHKVLSAAAVRAVIVSGNETGPRNGACNSLPNETSWQVDDLSR